MNIYRISQTVNTGYDTFDSAVVVAESEEKARKVSPSERHAWSDENNCWMFRRPDGIERVPEFHSWAIPDKVKVELMGVASDGFKENQLICFSYNAW